MAKTYRFLCYFTVTHPFFFYISLLEEDLPKSSLWRGVYSTHLETEKKNTL